MLTAGQPIGEAPVVVILVHGRGAGPENILDLVPALDVAGVTYLAPAATNRTWYPYGFMSDIAKNEPFLSSALSVLESLVAHVESSGVARDRIVVGGFSQGACLTTEFAIRNASRFGGIAAFSGGAIGPPGTIWATDDPVGTEGAPRAGSRVRRFGGTPIFFGCSDTDPHIPEPRVRESAAVCERMGADVTTRIYPGMGHLVNDDETDWLRSLLNALLSEKR